MTRKSTAEAPEPTPSPTPASEQRAVEARMDGREAMRLAAAQRDPENDTLLLEAGERYADDEDGTRELDDIRAGLHPLQRNGKHLDAWSKFQAKLATIRARHDA